MSAPGNYDNPGLDIRVDPNQLYQDGNVGIPQYGKVIIDAVDGITKIWNNLRLSWAGASASEAQDFFDQWNQAVERVFGTHADPKSGALNKLDGVAILASINYGAAEDTVAKMFNGMTASLDMGAMEGAMTADMPPGTAPLTVGQAPMRTPPAVPPGQTPDPITESAPAPGSAG